MKKIYILLLFLAAMDGVYASTRLQFRNISSEGGLNNRNVSSITQDQLGYIWVATMGGVSRYNGYKFEHYYFDSGDTLSSLNSNHVTSIFCSSDGLVFIGTIAGLNCYDVRKDKFLKLFPEIQVSITKIAEYNDYVYLATHKGLFRFRSINDKLEELGTNLTRAPLIHSLLFDGKGNVWCGLDGMGLAVYNLKSGNAEIFKNKQVQFSFRQNSVLCIQKVSEDLIILGTKEGISCFNTQIRQYICPVEYSALQKALSGIEVKFIFEKEPFVYWIGTLQTGLFIFDKSRNNIVRYLNNEKTSEFHSNNFQTYFKDRSGNIWIGTFDAGLDVYFAHAKSFNYDISLNQLVQKIFVTGIAEDCNRNLIIATNEDGLFFYNPDSKIVEKYGKGNSNLLSDHIRTVYVDSENNYWIGLYDGLQIFNPRKKSFKTLVIPRPNNGAVSVIQKNDRIYAGTDGQGLLVFDLDGALQRRCAEHGLNITKVVEFTDRELLFESYGNGLFTIDINNYSIRPVLLADIKKYPGLVSVIDIFKDKEGIVWAGTYNYGLYSLDFQKSRIQNYNIHNGLPSTDVVGLHEDEDSHIWISTSNGLVALDKNSNSLKSFFQEEGVNNYQFHQKASLKDKLGNIYFGGNLGLTYFNPSEIIKGDGDAPRIVLENLYIQNLLVTPSDEKSMLVSSLPYTKQITLTHKDQIFSIDIVAFDYLAPGKITYSYMLEGFDTAWYDIGTQRRVSYSNLPRGNYTFKAKAVSHSGMNSENVAELKIRVKPAPWFSVTAWIVYLAILAGISFFISNLRFKAFVYKKDSEFQYSENRREKEINVMKQKFFTNISHELRTPLTLIFGLVTQLAEQKDLSPKVRDFTQNLYLNVNRLLKLVNQLLAYKKLEGEELSLWIQEGNVNDAIRQNIELFQVYAKEKEISIDFQEDDNYDFCFDKDKLEKVLNNLLSNAIKHSPPGGNIGLVVSRIPLDQFRLDYKDEPEKIAREYIEISVTDHGTGIQEKDWDTIFDRYKQIETYGKLLPDYSGTGIGLNFTKSLVEMHKGKIRMESKPGKFTIFSFALPFDRSVYNPKDFAVVSSGKEQMNPDSRIEQSELEMDVKLDITPDFEKTILIVEDDPQLNIFIASEVKKYYSLLTAADGEKGLQLVRQKCPDLVISDIMMPKMDGYELTKALKESNEFCHIPVILLTAKTEIFSQIEGMHSGAELYIPKPFNIYFLLSAIDSQLKNRKRIHEIFLSGRMPNLERAEINQRDIAFLSKLNTILEKELANPDLDIQFLAKSMNLSRSVFYRKFLSLTKLSPISYITKFRINNSVELIKTEKYSITEISELTGFSSPSYFSRAFKQEKGISPRDYVHQ